jgi:hypothetical protein
MGGYSYRRRRFRRKNSSKERIAGVAIAAVVIAAAASKGHHLPPAAAPGQHAAAGTPASAGTTAVTTPDGTSYTPPSWAQAFLAVDSLPQTACNLAAIEAWEAEEGGQWNNSASYNPLNTTYDGPGGSWLGDGKITATINSAGVRAYDAWADGFTANLAALNNGLYGGVLSALRAGDDAQAVADAVASSPWGTAPFTASC